jgi:hypothetical protein
VSPIERVRPRHREIGRLRLGARTGPRGAPTALETWRLTSSHLEPIRVAAELWGGEVAEHDGVYDLTTEVSSLPVLIPDQDVAASQWLEEWSAGGLVRRCDGVTELLSGEPCLAETDQPCACQPTTHLLVVLPDLPDLGVWRLTTRGWAAASELPTSVELVRQISRGGLPRAELAIEHRSRRTGGQTHAFVVPVLRVPVSLSELAAAGERVLVDASTGEILPSSRTPELGPSVRPAPGGPHPGRADTTSSEADPPVVPASEEGAPPEPEGDLYGEGGNPEGSGRGPCLHLAGTRAVTGARGQRVEVCVGCGRPMEVTR